MHPSKLKNIEHYLSQFKLDDSLLFLNHLLGVTRGFSSDNALLGEIAKSSLPVLPHKAHFIAKLLLLNASDLGRTPMEWEQFLSAQRLADASSGGVGRMKIAEGGTILPQDRFFFRYSYLDNVRYSNGGQHLNRYVPGFEKSFGDGMFSVEVRAPFAANTVTSSTLNGDTFSSGSDTRFGNLTVYLKSLLLDTGKFAVSGGLGVVTPTASDTRVSYANGTPLLSIQNDSVRLQPFLGGLYTPNDRLFVQSFLQWDGAANGNRVAINSTGTGLTSAGRITDPSNLFLDVGAGYWLYRSNEKRGLTGIIPMVEIHQNSVLQPGDVVTAGPFQVGNFTGTTSLTNIVAGTTFEFGKSSNLTASYVGPVGGGSDRQFDGGLQVFYSFTPK